jgi:hypothetical protein
MEPIKKIFYRRILCSRVFSLSIRNQRSGRSTRFRERKPQLQTVAEHINAVIWSEVSAEGAESILAPLIISGASGTSVDWGTAPHDGRFRVRFSPWGFSSYIFLLSTFSGPGLQSASNRNEPRGIPLELPRKKFLGQSVEPTNLPSCLC